MATTVKGGDSILIFLPSLSGGGAERVMVHLANGFARQGFPVELVLARAEGPYRAEVDNGVRVVDLQVSRVLFALLALIRHFRATRPAVLLSTQSHANLVAIWAVRLAGASTRIVIREANTASRSSANAPTLRGRMMPFLMRLFYPWADAVVAPSQGVLDDLCRNFNLLPGKVRLLYNPSVSAALLAKAEVPLTHPWFASSQPPVVLGVGRLTRQKDFATLIRAFARAEQTGSMRLLILGEGEERRALEGLVRELGLEDKVSLPGFVENPFNYMKRAALFVLSSAWEGLPNVLIQALACGTPVVATDCPSGPAEVLENGRLGVLVKVGDVDAMSVAILNALNGQDGQAGRQRIDRAMDFLMEKIVPQYLRVLFPH